MAFFAGGSGMMGMGGRRTAIHPDPSAIDVDIWALAEETAQEVVNYIHPTMDSEEKRKDVTDFMQRLIRCYAPCEVFPYGSVPLKTYLPDGDIDLTALSVPDNEESLAREVLAILQAEELNENAEYHVRDTRFIDAEVKLVKCVVQDIVIDISFNQLGGLCSLCFLEQVDRLVGKNHLFKQSIMLIKCWCYYESRILGAHHGLISTYGLEILVLYIFQFFHASLNTPVEVLYRFLDCYSRFDWEKYCISLSGPVRKSSLPEIVVEMPDNGRNSLLLSEEFLRNYMEMFSVPARTHESNKRVFQQKHLNIIDPLKENNNLGRSVHRGNYYRICSAFRYGVRKFGQILLLPQDKIGDGIKKFFSNTIKRHGYSHLGNLKNSSLSIDADSSGISSSTPSLAEFFCEEELVLKSSAGDFDHDALEVEDKCTSMLTKAVSLEMVSEISCLAAEPSVLQQCLSGDANDLATSTHQNPTSANESSSGGTYSASLYGREHFAQNLPSTMLCAESVWGENEKLGSGSEHGEFRPGCSSGCQLGTEYGEGFGSAISSLKTCTVEEDVSLDLREKDVASIAGDSEVWNPLADLTGDYDGHIRSLLYGKFCQGYTLSVAGISPFWFQNNELLLSDQQSMPPVFVGSMLYSAENAMPSTATYNFEERSKVRGTGTFIPTMVNTYRDDRALRGKGKNRAFGGHGVHHRSTSSRGWAPALPPKDSASENSSREGSHAWPAAAQERGKSSGFRPSHHSAGDSRVGEFGYARQYPEGGSYQERATTRFSQRVPCAKPVWGRKDRLADQSLAPEE
ncbi:PREDICTED: uncharacterized protein LOC109156416 isoform X2 [Ipomoea nil]|uniref:uncharacterized protein LOC109156416 isoform X2 n=1 Tax=Ipomoea nil TaxID=35883 RepID=UPI0009019C8B|nr:PREDICTED: uncharacterized protein LOC109156416 isoform X2 [Ipomoea nil]